MVWMYAQTQSPGSSLLRRIFACFFLIKKLPYVGQGFLIDILSFLDAQIYRKWGPTRDYHQIYSTISTVFLESGAYN
jgi:hypothetical protein